MLIVFSAYKIILIDRDMLDRLHFAKSSIFDDCLNDFSYTKLKFHNIRTHLRNISIIFFLLKRIAFQVKLTLINSKTISMNRLKLKKKKN